MEEPDIEGGWGFYYPAELVMKGFTEWHNQEYRRMPDVQDLLNRDPLWEHDLETMRTIVYHKKPKEDKK